MELLFENSSPSHRVSYHKCLNPIVIINIIKTNINSGKKKMPTQHTLNISIIFIQSCIVHMAECAAAVVKLESAVVK